MPSLFSKQIGQMKHALLKLFRMCTVVHMWSEDNSKDSGISFQVDSRDLTLLNLLTSAFYLISNLLGLKHTLSQEQEFLDATSSTFICISLDLRQVFLWVSGYSTHTHTNTVTLKHTHIHILTYTYIHINTHIYTHTQIYTLS